MNAMLTKCLLFLDFRWLYAMLLVATVLPFVDARMEEPDTSSYVIIEGDIMVRADFLLKNPFGTFTKTDFWPSGIVPYQFNANVSGADQNAMLIAMQEWERVANVAFVVRNGENDWVEILGADGNSSAVGRQGGRQEIRIFNWNCRFIMCHELAHCLGFWHEQSRPDRDNYISVHTEFVPDGNKHNFDIRGDAGQYGPYDFESVMHYGECAFAPDHCTTASGTCSGDHGCDACIICIFGICNTYDARTITCQPQYQQFQNVIGQRTFLSHLDTLTMSFLYPETDWRFVDVTVSYSGGTTPDGSFLRPWWFFNQYYYPEGGTVWIQPGDYDVIPDNGSPMTVDKAMTIRAPLGGVKIGDFPNK